MGEKYVRLGDLVRDVAEEAAEYRKPSGDVGPIRRAWAKATTTGDFLVRREAESYMVPYDEERDFNYPNYGLLDNNIYVGNAAPELTTFGRVVHNVVDCLTGDVSNVELSNPVLEINSGARKDPDSFKRISGRDK